MKKILIVLILGILMVSCGGTNNTSDSGGLSIGKGNLIQLESKGRLKDIVGKFYLDNKEIDYLKYADFKYSYSKSANTNDEASIGTFIIRAQDEKYGQAYREAEFASQIRKIILYAVSEDYSFDELLELAEKYDMVFLDPTIEGYLNLRDILRKQMAQYPYVFMLVPKEFVK